MSSLGLPAHRSAPGTSRGTIVAAWFGGSLSLVWGARSALVVISVAVFAFAAVTTFRYAAALIGSSDAGLRPAGLVAIGGVLGTVYVFVAMPTLIAYGEPSTAQIVAAAIAYPAFLVAPFLSGAGWWLGRRRHDPVARGLGGLGLMLGAVSLVIALALAAIIVAVASQWS
ncbi:MAG TPA: hypothetical protein PKD59_01630 [Miltoncostaeaceae bacterium]|nr:hypothetical protein [Miltoncostaeaceae bacterium]